MKIAVFVVGCVLALPSAVGVGLCSGVAGLLQHPPSDMPVYNAPGASATALGMLVILAMVVLLAAVANRLIGIGAHSMGAHRGEWR